MMEYFIAALGGYLLGSIPFGLVLTKLAGYGDIRDIGSGNIGATNVLRTGNKPLALATLILDSSKGAIAVLLGGFLLKQVGIHISGSNCEGDCDKMIAGFVFSGMCVAGFFALVGHLFPVWLKFKGGKGVATTFGTYLALAPIVGGAACVLWLLTALITRYSSLSALVAIGLAPIVAHFVYHDPNLSGLCGVIATIVFYKHRENMKRLVRGDEPKIGKKK